MLRVVGALLFLPGAMRAATAQTPLREIHGGGLHALVHAPSERAAVMPLLLYLHGAGESGSNVRELISEGNLNWTQLKAVRRHLIDTLGTSPLASEKRVRESMKQKRAVSGPTWGLFWFLNKILPTNAHTSAPRHFRSWRRSKPSTGRPP